MADHLSEEQRRRANVRLGLVLAAVALAFGLAFVAKVILLGR